ncbi:MAG: DUF444 family protein, partial [Duganella sp.]
EGRSGVSPRFVINALSNAIIQSQRSSLSTMDLLLALKDGIDSDARIEPARKALSVSFEQEVEDLLGKYLDEVEAMLDNRQVKDPITSEERRPDERFLRAVAEKIHISGSGKQSFRQEVVRKAMSAYKRGERFGLGSHAQLRDALQQYLFEQRRDVLRPPNYDADDDEGGNEDGDIKRLMEFAIDDILEWLWDQFKLPELRPRGTATLDEPDYVREGWDKRGARSRLDRRRAVKEAIKRRAVQTRPAPFTNDDLRFRQLVRHPRPITWATACGSASSTGKAWTPRKDGETRVVSRDIDDVREAILAPKYNYGAPCIAVERMREGRGLDLDQAE